MVRRLLLDWFGQHARDLPWRRRRSPYRVWVSEVMLQQTRVEAVIDPYRRFLSAFPSLAALARAGEEEVLALWSGLGYYRRARMLHAGARFVVERHGGRLPRSRRELECVPGIGAYTAGALLSIAFGQREAALDANVTRVVARLLGIEDPSRAREEVAAFAGELVDCPTPGDVNEALMDLGSSTCTARVARCGDCPLQAACVAATSAEASSFAGPRERKPPRRVRLACAVVSCGERVLFARRPREEALLAGLWDLPTLEVEDGEDGREQLERLVSRKVGTKVPLAGPRVEVRHEIVGRRITAAVYVGLVAETPANLSRDARLLADKDLAGVGLPALPVKILGALGSTRRLPGA